MKIMKNLLEKLNYKGNKRIALLNSEDWFINKFSVEFSDIKIDREIDPRYPYDFIMVFVKKISDVENYAPVALHNLLCDGVLWFCYPKKSSRKYHSDVDRDHGWKILNDSGYYGIRLVSIDEDWSALRFRYVKFIKSVSGRFAR
jgi:hypothetical protein